MRFFHLLFALLPLYSLSAIEWPADPRYMDDSFLSNAKGSISRSLSFKDSPSVQAVDSGEVLFYNDKEPFSPLAYEDDLVVISHDNGFITSYSGLSLDDLLNSKNKADHDTTYDFQFNIIDQKLNRVVNPYLLLPGVKDARSPKIGEVVLKAKAQGIVLGDQNELSADSYKVYIETGDTFGSLYSGRSIPYMAELFLLGSLKIQREAVYLSQQGTGLSLCGEIDLDFLFNDRLLYLGDIDLIAGQNVLEITVEDIQGNRSSVEFDIKVSP